MDDAGDVGDDGWVMVGGGNSCCCDACGCELLLMKDCRL